MVSSEYQNVWVSATECQALLGSVNAIEQGLLELKRGKVWVPPTEQAVGSDGAIAAIERGCKSVRQLLTVLRDTDLDF